MSNEVISLSHGSGGKATNKLINNLSINEVYKVIKCILF